MAENDSLSDQEPETVSFASARTQLSDSQKKIALSLEQTQKKRKERNRQIDLKLKEQSKKKKEFNEGNQQEREQLIEERITPQIEEQESDQLIPITQSTLLAREIANINSTHSLPTSKNNSSKHQLAAQAKAFLKRSLSKNQRKRIIY